VSKCYGAAECSKKQNYDKKRLHILIHSKRLKFNIYQKYTMGKKKDEESLETEVTISKQKFIKVKFKNFTNVS